MKNAAKSSKHPWLLIPAVSGLAVLDYLKGPAGESPIRLADMGVPIILLSGIAVTTLVFAFYKYRTLLKRPAAAGRKRSHSDTDFIRLDKIQSDEKLSPGRMKSDFGIGTGVVKIFQQIKDNLEDPDMLGLGYRHLLDLSCENLGFDAGAIFLIDKNGRLKLYSHSGLKVNSDEIYTIVVEDYISELFQSDIPRFETDLTQIIFSDPEILTGYKAGWIIPLMPRGTEVGLIIFLHSEIPYSRENYIPKLDFVAISASWFYENHHNQIMIEKENRRNRMLVKTSLAISMSLDLDKVCNILVEQLSKSYGCSYSYIFLNEGDNKSMYIRQFYSQRGEPVFSANERFIDISQMSWLQDIIYLGNPVLMDSEEIASIPGEDAARLKIKDGTDALIAPLKHASKFEGVLVMVEQRTGDRNVLDQDIINLTAALVAQASATIENARMYSLITDRVAHLSTLFEVSQALNSDLDLIPFLERVLKTISRNFLINNCAFLIRKADVDELYVAATVGAYRDDVLGRRIKLGQGITGSAALERKTVNVGDVSKDERFIPSTWKTGSELAVPVILGNEVVGVLDVESTQKFAFSHKDEEFLQSVVDQVAVAVEKIKLKQQEKDWASKLAITNSIVKKLSGIFERNELLGEAVKGINEGYNYELVAVFMADTKGRLILAQQACRFGQGYEPGLHVESPNCLISQAARDRKNKFSDRVLSYEPDAGLRNVKSHYCIPLIGGNRLHGVLEIQDIKPAAISGNDRSTLQTIADFISITLNNVLLYLDTTDKAERLSLASHINQAISSTLDLQELFARVLKSLSNITGYHWATLVFKENGEYKTRSEYFEGYSGIEEALPNLDSMHKYFEDVIKKGKPGYYNVAAMKLNDQLRAQFFKLNINYLAIAPIKRENDLESFLLLGNPYHEGFKAKDQYLLADITQHLQIAMKNAMLYSELKKAYESLSETQEKLIQGEKFKALGELAAGIAHDFKNILAAIMGRAQLLNLAAESPAGVSQELLSKNLEIIEKSATDGVNILSRINEFTKNKNSLKFEPIDLATIINDTVEMSRSRWEDPRCPKHIEVKVNLADNLAILGDRAMMVEVFSNLIYNAVDAIDTEGVIGIDASVTGQTVIVQITDTGTGMDDATLKKIFDPYFTTKERLGTGLGLSMVYSIISGHNGEITVESELGKGSRFTIKLPRQEQRLDLSGTSILVVEDDKNVRNVLLELMTEMKATVTLAENYRQAVMLLKSQTFDLVLTDLGLPDKDGWGIIESAKAANPGCFIIPMSGWKNEVDRRELVSRGLVDVLQKPFTLNKVHELLRKFQHKRKANVGNFAK